MPIRAMLPVLLTLALLPAGLSADAITVWEHESFGGVSRVFETHVPRLADTGWNDRVSSLRVESGTWEICRDADYGNCRIVGGPGQQVSFESLASGWNDVISSLRPLSNAPSAGISETIANRLYRALLGREADPQGLRNAAAQTGAAALPDLVRSLAQSAEYRSASSRRSAAETLDQIYRGLLDRPADEAARTAFLYRIERGEVSQVVLDILGSQEFASVAGRTTAPGALDAPRNVQDIQVQARGTGVVIWGGKRYFDTVTAAKLVLGGDGRFEASFSGTTPHKLSGTFTREADGFFRVNVVDLADKPPFAVQGGIQLHRGQLARIDVTDGTHGTRDRMVYTFVAADYQPPREEARCQQEVGARLEKGVGSEGGLKLAFLAPTRVRASSNRDEIRGEVVILSENASALYRCEIDARSGQVLAASVDRH